MAGSAVPAAVAYLTAHIVTQVADKTVLVVEGAAGPYEPIDMIVVGETVRRQMTIDTFDGSVVETFTISVEVSSFAGGDNPSAVRARVYALGDAVFAVVRNDPTLGGAVAACSAAAVAVETTVGWHDSGKGRLAISEFELPCEAYL